MSKGVEMLEDIQAQIQAERREQEERIARERAMRVRLMAYLMGGFAFVSLLGGGAYFSGVFTEVELNGGPQMTAAEKRLYTKQAIVNDRQNHMQGVLTMHDPWPRVKLGN
uniref:Uncharacterized protein n=1 Tax=Magnetococcus massalia (strain MO-1) TaxID=451514 RepID=A0A1S7LGN1_MAGMO|nr:Conserved protein of unknown function [Candidatus Magnetococcus massalia]